MKRLNKYFTPIREHSAFDAQEIIRELFALGITLALAYALVITFNW